MKNDLTCAVAQDLLPSYADGLTSEETNEAVARHLAECGPCRAAYEKMTAPEAAAAEMKKDEKELAFLKKIKRRRLVTALCCALAALLLAGGAFGAIWYARAYRAEYPVSRADADITVRVTDGGKAEITLKLRAAEMTGGLRTNAVFDETTGRMTFSFTMRRARKGSSQVITASAAAPDGKKIESVYLDDVPLWENHVTITERAGLVFAAAHPYIGDMTLNAESAAALEIGKSFGSYENELTTSYKPYEWKMTFTEPVAEYAVFGPGGLTEDAVLLLATIDNLNAVTFSFPNREFTVTTELANSLFAKKLHESIKKAGKTPLGVQNILYTCRNTSFMFSTIVNGKESYEVIVEVPQTEAP